MSDRMPAGPRHEAATIGLVGMAHYSSHVMQLALAPLFPLLHDAFGVTFSRLGLAMGFFYVASGFGQAAAGVLVDRYGAHRLLIGGLLLLSASITLMGLASGYWELLPLAFLAGAGNSVFHPADLSILSHRITGARLGRAYALHGVSGTLGYASSPVLVAFVASYEGWRAALVALGLAGFTVAALLYVNRGLLAYPLRREARTGAAAHHPAYWQLVGAPVVLMAFTYFALTAFAATGIQTFSITALTSGYGLSLPVATLGLTLYLVGTSAGMLAGGFLAERTQQHHRVAMSGIAVAAVLMLLIAGLSGPAAAALPFLMLAGLAAGMTAPSRDVLIRRAATGIGMGSVFGFVYSGFDLGSSIAPWLFGALIDHGEQRAVFIVIAGAFALGVPTVLQVRQRSLAPAPAPAGAD